MIKIVEVFFCKSVISNLDGSPQQFIERFGSMKREKYPELVNFSVVILLTHSSALHHLLTVRIRNAEEIIFEGARQRLITEQPDRIDQQVGVVAPLNNVMVPEPGAYTVEILLNGDVRHIEVVSFD